MLDFFRWLQGFVRFYIIGNSPERFINIVTKNRISIWNTERVDGKMFACMFTKDYINIRDLAKKSRVRLKVKSRHGLPFFIKVHKDRVGILVGVAVFALVIYVMSCFVWTIDVVGLETISYTKVMQTLKENGLYVGAFKPKCSFTNISRNTMLEIEDIGWMSLNTLGSHCSVEIKEKAKSPKVDDFSIPANVKAKRDGQIISINTAKGEACFGVGSAVVKDQLLVNCVIEDQLGRVKLVRADAQVIAKTTRKKIFTVEKECVTTQLSFADDTKTARVIFFDVPYDFSFAGKSDSAVRKTTKSVELFDTQLPLSVTTQRIYTKDEKNIILKEKKAKAILQQKAYLYEAFCLSECIINDKHYEFTENDSQFVLTALYDCEEDIAYQQEIDINDVTIKDEIPQVKEEIQ